MGQGFLDKVYTAAETRTGAELYDAWASTYNAEITQNGYVTPTRCAQALAQCNAALDSPVLDFGCGTGLSGLAMSAAGFSYIDGMDVSTDMLKQAAQTGVYRNLHQTDPNTEAQITNGAYSAVAAVGVIGAGAAPVSVFHAIMNALPKGGKLVFSFNDHALSDPVHEAALSEWVDVGAAHLLFKEYGPHLPGINLNSNVYVVEKA
ncbi:methyltransferase domain-containing protein [Ascidiaceihabitans sp.]|uniref:class I SAM-dependent DNA methyltransferase n=1 Tax=Ascidiaceihabitans sp. TaxID=1872644 RepID=UPI003296E0BF